MYKLYLNSPASCVFSHLDVILDIKQVEFIRPDPVEELRGSDDENGGEGRDPMRGKMVNRECASTAAWRMEIFE